MQVYCHKQHKNSVSSRFCTLCGEALPLPEGQIVDQRYEIIRLLGQGGFGRTYLAVDTKNARQECVLKEFAPQVENPQDLQKAKELFEREAKVLKKLQHSQIPKFHSSLQIKFTNKDFFFLVQDYIDGENYHQLLEQRQYQGQAFTEVEILDLLKNVLPILSYIHSLDVIHRDLSPDNLICRRSDHLPVLIDFGGVKQLPASQGFWSTRLGSNGTLLGKVGYAPEEQLRQGRAFKSSDLYSLAVTVLVLLTAKEPQALYDSYQGDWLWGKAIKVSPKLETILKKMLAYNPNDRYQQADQVLKDLSSQLTIQSPNPYLTNLKTMIAAPGRRSSQLVSKLNSKTQLAVQNLPVPIWLRPFIVTLIASTIAISTFAGAYAVVKSIFGAVSSVKVPSISLPTLPTLPKNPLTKSDGDKQTNHDLQKILQRRQQLEIPQNFFIGLVDETFYTKKPDLKGRNISAKPEDAGLRNEWAGIAEDLLNKIEQANLSTEARRKLGTYSQRDYEHWQLLAQRGELGKYKTFAEFKEDVYRKFNPLFPGQQRGKLNFKTYLQLWQAIAFDLSK